MADGLLEPDGGFFGAFACVWGLWGVFFCAGGVPGRCEWNDDEEGVDGAGDHGEEGWIGEGVDVVEFDGGREAELVC